MPDVSETWERHPLNESRVQGVPFDGLSPKEGVLNHTLPEGASDTNPTDSTVSWFFE